MLSGNDSTAIDVSNIVDLKTLTLDKHDVTADVVVTLAGQSVTIKNTVATNQDEVTFDSTADTALNLTVDGLNMAQKELTIDVKGEKVATMNLTATGKDSAFALTNTATSDVLTTLNIDGTGKIMVQANAVKSLTTIDAHGNSGGVHVLAEGLTKAAAITGGAGKDIFEFKGEAVTLGHTVDGGEGCDAIILNSAKFGDSNSIVSSDTGTFTGAAFAWLNSDKVSSIEQLTFWNDKGMDASFDLDMGKLANIHTYGANHKGTISNIDANDTIIALSGRGLKAVANSSEYEPDGDNCQLILDTSSANDTVNLIVGTETDFQTGNSYALIKGGDFSTLNASGKGNLYVELTDRSTVDATHLSGVFYAKGSAGSDTIIAGSGGSTIVGGAGNDKITLGAGADTVQFSFNTSDVINASTNGKDVVTGFDLAKDTLGVKAFLTTQPHAGNWTPPVAPLTQPGPTDVADNTIYNVTLDAAVSSMDAAALTAALFGNGKPFSAALQGTEALFMVKGSDGNTIVVFYDADFAGNGTSTPEADLYVGAVLVGVTGDFTGANFV